MKTNKIIALLLILSCAVIKSVSAAEHAVIVNAGNDFPGSEESLKNEVRRLFLKDKKKWKSGVNAKPLSFKKESPGSKAFRTVVLKMDEPALAQHWLKAKQKTGETPPRQISSVKAIIKLVGKNKGAVGFIPINNAVPLGDNIKILFKF